MSSIIENFADLGARLAEIEKKKQVNPVTPQVTEDTAPCEYSGHWGMTAPDDMGDLFGCC